MLGEGSVQMASMPFNVFKNKGNVEAMLNVSLNHLNLIQQYASFQQAGNIFLHFQQC